MWLLTLNPHIWDIQQTTLTTLDAIVGCVILCVWRCYFSNYCCWKAKMIIHGRTTCRIAHHVIFLTWMPNWSFFGYYPRQPSMYVMQVIFRGRHYIGVWSMFERLAFGMLDATFEWNICQHGFAFDAWHKLRNFHS